MQNRRSFLRQTAITSSAMAFFPNTGWDLSKLMDNKLNISLAQWSLNRSIRDGTIKAEDFASISKNTYQIDAIEYVSGLYPEKGADEAFWLDLKKRADDEGVKSLLIMVDEEGDLGDMVEGNRLKAVENHYKWVDNAKALGCHSIRVNAFGQGSIAQVKSALVDGLGRLAEYGASQGINILIENHGLHSSNGKFVVDVIKRVNSPHLGTLPDFGNWCLTKKWGGTSDGDCTQAYDFYTGLSDFLPYAKGVSAKSYDFDEKGSQISLDYHRFLRILKEASYNGYIGIEYEGNNLGEHEGIIATKALLERVWSSL